MLAALARLTLAAVALADGVAAVSEAFTLLARHGQNEIWYGPVRQSGKSSGESIVAWYSNVPKVSNPAAN
ncbi:MAG TPA: hypothetical protein VHH90_03940 [Polyangia bacterium]|nr:hypothetical protein [Polyangia bacterium]